MTKPIKPEEVQTLKNKEIPEKVYEVFNSLIVKNWKGPTSTSVISQDSIVELLVQEMSVTRQEIFDNSWLDVENAYRLEGWLVSYHKPDWDENYQPYFKFSYKKK